eukprot:4550829-Ditylum_brightwellii.AAC.1
MELSFNEGMVLGMADGINLDSDKGMSYGMELSTNEGMALGMTDGMELGFDVGMALGMADGKKL